MFHVRFPLASYASGLAPAEGRNADVLLHGEAAGTGLRKKYAGSRRSPPCGKLRNVNQIRRGEIRGREVEWSLGSLVINNRVTLETAHRPAVNLENPGIRLRICASTKIIPIPQS